LTGNGRDLSEYSTLIGGHWDGKIPMAMLAGMELDVFSPRVMHGVLERWDTGDANDPASRT